MKEFISTILGVGLAAVATAEAPSVTNVSVEQTTDRLVTVGYTLSGEAAVTTMCVETNAGDARFEPIVTLSYDALRGTSSLWPAGGHAVGSASVLGKIRTLTGFPTMDLPTDAQWEFACRAGTGTALYDGHELDNATTSALVKNLAVYAGNGNALSKVGTCRANGFGLYDMYGNVWELCLDYYQENLTDVDANTGPASGSNRIRRGGCCSNTAGYCRSATRLAMSPSGSGDTIGFRVACEAYAAR